MHFLFVTYYVSKNGIRGSIKIVEENVQAQLSPPWITYILMN